MCCVCLAFCLYGCLLLLLLLCTELMFLETSALTGEGVTEVFMKCARTILTKIETGTFMTATDDADNHSQQ